MTELNKDGLAIGEPVSFEDMQRIQREHYKKGAVSGKQKKVRKSRKPTVSNVEKAEESEASQESIPATEASKIL